MYLHMEKDRGDGDHMEVMNCACCDGKATVEKVGNRGWIVSCESDLCVCQKYGHASKDDAVNDWNTRRFVLEDEMLVRYLREKK